MQMASCHVLRIHYTLLPAATCDRHVSCHQPQSTYLTGCLLLMPCCSSLTPYCPFMHFRATSSRLPSLERVEPHPTGM